MSSIGNIFKGDMKGFTDALGFTDYGASDRMEANAAKNSERSYNLSKEQLAFQREQYDEWKKVYGDLQEDVGTYYKNLTGESLAAPQLASIQAEHQKAQANIDAQLAQRGLSSSGLEAQALMQNEYSAAAEKANVRANQDQMAAQQKMKFIGLGLGQGTQMLGTQANVSNNAASNLMGNANTSLGSAAGIINTNTSNTTQKSIEIGNNMMSMFGSMAGGA